jgi:hypothetical protein
VKDEADETAAHIRALMGVTNNKSEREYRIASYNANQHGGMCGKCHRRLADDEPVWRDRVGHRAFGRRYPTLPLCTECKSKWTEFYKAEPCEGCGRPVHDRVTKRKTWRTFCCRKCKSRAVSAAMHRKRVEERGTRECIECAEVFEPTRADAKFCSVACRQKNYRRRVTVQKLPTEAEHSIRNGSFRRAA